MPTEIEKEFYKDSFEKKKIGRNASKRPKRTGCRLPSDNLTQSEIRKKESMVMVYNRNKPMAWEDFKRLSPDFQKDYLSYLRDEFHASDKDIGEMMGISRSPVRNFRSDLLPDDQRHIRMTALDKNKWKRFLAQEERSPETKTCETPTKVVNSKPVNKTVEAPLDKPVIGLGSLMNSVEFNFKQGTTINDLVYALTPFFKGGSPVIKITIEY